MRNGQKRMRGRNNQHRKNQNPLTRVYESNGPDVKIRGTASHIAEKYIQLARDAQGSGDPIAAENYYQHAEHYFRLIAAAQEQLRQQNPYYNQQQPGQGAPQGAADDGYDDDGDDQPFTNEPSYVPQPQGGDGEANGLPAFITGSQPQPGANAFGQNGHEQGDRQDRFGHRRRRRHRGGFRSDRPENYGNPQQSSAPVPSDGGPDQSE